MSRLPDYPRFFALARERYRIMLRHEVREAWPWTEDQVFQQYRFTCVHREDDRVTRHFRERFRDEVRDDAVRSVFAIAAYRWFNRESTGELLRDLILGDWDFDEALRRVRGLAGPVVTGAYIVVGERGYRKGEGVLRCIERFRDMVDPERLEDCATLRDAHQYLCGVPYLKGFTAYELISDLRWTCVLGQARDIDSWAHIGPGATRGIGRLLAGDPGHFNQSRDQEQMLEVLRHLVDLSRAPRTWPKRWRRFEARDAEGWLCEFDKYERARLGDGRMKRRYRPPEEPSMEGRGR